MQILLFRHPSSSKNVDHSAQDFPGKGLTARETWTAEAGSHDVYAYVDPEHEIEEWMLWNNTLGGTLAVATNNGFAQWQASQFSPEELADPEVSGPAATAPNGMANLMAYALGLDRDELPGEENLRLASTGDDGWSYRYRRPVDRPELTYRVGTSTDLGDWFYEGITHERISTDGAHEIWEARAGGDYERLFFRLVVVESGGGN